MKINVVNDALHGLEESQIVELESFTVDFISKLGRGIVRCLEPNEKPFLARSGEPYELHFLEPAYVASVEIEFSRPVLGPEFEVSVLDSLSNRSVRSKIGHNSFSNPINFSINCVTSGVSIYLRPNGFELIRRRTLEIKRITILGYQTKDFEVLDNSLTHLQGFREAAIEEINQEKLALQARLEKVQQREVAVSKLEEEKNLELAELEEKIEAAEEQSVIATTKLADLKEEVARSETRKQTLADQISAHETTIRNITGEISKDKENLRSLAVETAEAERRLRDLTNNVNLFSEEFSSFSNHGATQAKTFIWLSVLPLLIICGLTAQLLMGAVDLSIKYVKEPDLDLVTVFVTRLPYIFVCSSILAVCYSVLRFLFARISVIYAERLDFSKIGIVAKDVASASATGLSLNDEQIYEARTYLKIEMLKSYLGGNIGAFKYEKRRTNDGPLEKPTTASASPAKPAEEDEH